jgi:hypothetical protein
MGNSSGNINATSSCWPIVSYCTFDGNDITSQGIEFSNYTVLDVEHSIFENHTGDGIHGTNNGQLTVTSCEFESNSDKGLELDDIATTMTNCSIKNSNSDGIQVSGADLTMEHILIDYAGGSGISATNGSSLILKNGVIRHSGKQGINLNYNTGTTILNSWIHNNGINHSASEGSGIYSSNHTVNTLLLRNCTLYDNYTYGVECGQYGADPNIRNCIIFSNDSNDLYRQNGSFNKVNYCLLQHTHSGVGNRTGDPEFLNIEIDADDLHLDALSQCVDAGDPNGNYDETDIDGEPRMINGRADLGGDELYISPVDFNADNIVDYADLFVLCQVWLTEVEGTPDIVDNNFIDFADFTAFAKDWQWTPAWPDKRILLATDFGSGIPAGWTVVDGHSDNKKWVTNNPGQRTSSYWTGNFCIADSDNAGYVDMNEVLITPVIDCTDALEVTLKFSHDFVSSGGEKCDVDISVNNGAWQTILQYTESASGNIVEDISEFAANQSNIRIRWHYYNAYFDWYWGIDNVQIIGNYRTGGMQMRMDDDGGSTLKNSQMAELESSFFGDMPLTEQSNGLMLSATESEAKRPERLITKSQKFYDLTPATTISAKQKELESIKNEKYLANIQTKQVLQAESQISLASEQAQVEQIVDVNQILNWLDELWQNDNEIRNSMTEEEYLEFRKSIEDSGE